MIVGDALPDIELVDHDGRPEVRHLRDFLRSSHLRRWALRWLECKKSREGAGGEVGEKVAEHRHPLLVRGDREFGPPSADAVELGARLRRDDVAGCRPPGIRSRVA